MSRKDELLKLAQLFHSQARRTLDRPAKQALRKLGDHYQNEAEKAFNLLDMGYSREEISDRGMAT